MGISLQELKFMTPRTLSFCIKQFREYEFEKFKAQLISARLGAYISLSAWTDLSGKTPEDILPFEWEKKKEVRLTQVKIRKVGSDQTDNSKDSG